MKINSDGMPLWVAILLVAISLIVTTLLIHRSNYIVFTAGFILAMSLNILDRAIFGYRKRTTDSPNKSNHLKKILLMGIRQITSNKSSQRSK